MPPISVPQQDLVETRLDHSPHRQRIRQYEEDIRVIDDRIRHLFGNSENPQTAEHRQILLSREKREYVRARYIQSVSPPYREQVKREYELLHEVEKELQRQKESVEEIELIPRLNELREAAEILRPSVLSRELIVSQATRRLLLSSDLPAINTFVKRLVKGLVALGSLIKNERATFNEIHRLCVTTVQEKEEKETEKYMKSFRNRARQCYYRLKTAVKGRIFKAKKKCNNFVRKVVQFLNTKVKSLITNTQTIVKTSARKTRQTLRNFLALTGKEEKLNGQVVLIEDKYFIAQTRQRHPAVFSDQNGRLLVDLHQVTSPNFIEGFGITPPRHRVSGQVQRESRQERRRNHRQSDNNESES